MVKIAELRSFDVAEYLDTEETIAEYLNQILEENDHHLLMAAIGDIAKARGMTAVAKEAGLSRESLYKSFGGRSVPRFDTMSSVLGALGVKLVAVPASSCAEKLVPA